MADAFIGKLLAGKYKIKARIAHGGMGTVYRALRIKDRRDTAVKVLHPHMVDSQEAVSRFLREGQALASLQHPNIVELFDSGQTEDGEIYIAMEYVNGQTLAQIIKAKKQLPLDVTLMLMTQLCDAVGAAHAHGVVHRDLTPGNVIVMAKGMKIVDFGIAKRVDSNTQLTAAGTILGTPAFLAPEQINGDGTVDPRSDVYALGALLHLCLTGLPPFQGPSPAAIMAKQVSEAPQNLVEGPLHAVINQALQKKKEDRFQTSAELRDAIQLAAQVPVPPAADSHRSTLRTRAVVRQRAWWPFAVGGAIIALALTLVWFLRS